MVFNLVAKSVACRTNHMVEPAVVSLEQEYARNGDGSGKGGF